MRRGGLGAILLALLMPSIAVLQPFLPGPLQSMALWTRVLLLPMGAAWLIRDRLRWPVLGALVVLMILTTYAASGAEPNDELLFGISIVAAVVLFQAGRALSVRDDWRFVWVWLVRGVTLFNVITLAAYAAALAGVLDPTFILEATQKDLDFGLDRFSFGNAIEAPFVMTSLLLAGMRQDDSGRSHLLAASLNLVTALVSQSRVVVLAALLLFVLALRRGTWSQRIAVVALLAASLFVFGDSVQPIVGSLSERFAGNDRGSADDRNVLFSNVISHFSAFGLVFGNGVASTLTLMRETMHDYRTVESAGLQAVYELGLLGIGLIVLSLRPLRAASRRRRIDPTATLLWIQLLFFIPVFHLMPLCLFGMACTHPRRRDGTPRPSPPETSHEHS